jgi:hypothetical protein
MREVVLGAAASERCPIPPMTGHAVLGTAEFQYRAIFPTTSPSLLLGLS